MNNLNIYFFIFSFLFGSKLFGQINSELEALEAEQQKSIDKYSASSFKTSRVINNASLEFTAPGVLDFKISHRFGPVNKGFYDIFGLDQATIRIGFDYGINRKMMIGFGRSGLEKAYDGYFRYKLAQQTNDNKMPITAIWVSSLVINTLQFQNADVNGYFLGRFSYTNQLVIGRKFSDGFTFQLMPSLVHRNLVATNAESNTVFALGFAGRQKINKRVSINAEYFYIPKNQLADRFIAPLSFGFDIETGGHVFQLHFTNASAINEKGFITETSDSWRNGGFKFGFNISRVFTIKDSKSKQ